MVHVIISCSSQLNLLPRSHPSNFFPTIFLSAQLDPGFSGNTTNLSNNFPLKWLARFKEIFYLPPIFIHTQKFKDQPCLTDPV